MNACPGNCNAWWRALTGEEQDASETRPRPGDPVWCSVDAGRIRRLLAELPDLAAIYEAQVTGFHEQGRSLARGGTAPSPSQAADDIDELDDMLVGHEMAYRADFNRRNPDRPMLPSPPRRGVLATVTDTTAAWLSRHLDDILAADMGEDFGLEVALWHREFVAKTRTGDGRKLGAVPCPQCGLRLLAWVDDRGLKCANCPRYVTKAEYDEDVIRHLERAG